VIVTDDAHLGFGIDIGGTGIKGAVVDLRDGSMVSQRFRLDTPQPSTPKAVADTAAKVIANVDYRGPIGATFPGVVLHGVVNTAANMDPSWLHTSLVDEFAPRMPGAVTALNDADAAGLAEVRYGAGKGQQGVVLMVTLGTGIGTALIHNGVLVPNRAAASARERYDLSWKNWAKRVERYLRHLESLLWPDLFILGGGVSKKPDNWFREITNVRTPMVIAALANNAGIAGAALAAHEEQD
jgi:polyphosphate glucokinase